MKHYHFKNCITCATFMVSLAINVMSCKKSSRLDVLQPEILTESLSSTLNLQSLTVVDDHFRDISFSDGLAVTPTDATIVNMGGGFENTFVDTLKFGGSGANPNWYVAQWNTKFNLANALMQTAGDGSLFYQNTGQSYKVAKYSDNSLMLQLHASKEYDSARHPSQTKWPAFLLAKNYYDSGPAIGANDVMDFSMQVKLVDCVNMMAPGTYNPNLHTAHTPFFFLIKNRNSSSPDYNKTIWFGIRSYDYRYPTLSSVEDVSWDIGTNMYIYKVPPQAIWGNVSFHDKQWHKGRANLKPFIERALTVMKSHGVFLNTTLNDIKIYSMNFGWETPGTFDAAIRVKGISLKLGYETSRIDNFDRAATSWANKSTNPNPIGAAWTVIRGEWQIFGTGTSNNIIKERRLAGESISSNPILINNIAETDDSTTAFTLSADVKVNATVNSTLAGLAFNVVDSNNYYALRIGGDGLVQVIRAVNGTVTALSSETISLPGNTFYRLKLTFVSAYSFQWHITSTTGTAIASGIATDNLKKFASGFAGLYASSDKGEFDRFLFKKN